MCETVSWVAYRRVTVKSNDRSSDLWRWWLRMMTAYQFEGFNLLHAESHRHRVRVVSHRTRRRIIVIVVIAEESSQQPVFPRTRFHCCITRTRKNIVSKARIPLPRVFPTRDGNVSGKSAIYCGEVADVDQETRMSRPGKVHGFKPLRHVEMVRKNPVETGRQVRLRRANGICERARHDTTNGLWHIADLSRGETVKSPTSPCLVTGMSRSHGLEMKWNEIYCSVAAKRLDCDNTVHVYTSLYHTIRRNTYVYSSKKTDKIQVKTETGRIEIK